MDSRHKKTILGTVSALTGALLTGWALWLILAVPENPWPYRTVSVGLTSADWTILGLFAAAYAALSFRSAEVNDRMFANSSAMVIASASMYFLASGYNATPLVVLIAAAGPFDIEDFRRRRIFQPAINFGLLIVSALLAGTVGDLLVDPGQEGVVTATTFAIVAVVGGLIAATYTIANLTLVRLSVRFADGARNLLHGMLAWVEAFAATPYGGWALFVIAFAESSFFPIPPDVLLIPLCLGDPQRALWFALLCTVGSVLGGMAGYGIGHWGGRPLVLRWFGERRVRAVETYYDRWNAWATGVGGLTPLPYKLFTIAGGVFAVRFWIFVLASIAARGLRFFTIAILI